MNDAPPHPVSPVIARCRDSHGRWVAGQSGNPAGRPPLTPPEREAGELLTALVPRAVARLEQLLGHPDARVVIRAIQLVLAHGLHDPDELDMARREVLELLHGRVDTETFTRVLDALVATGAS